MSTSRTPPHRGDVFGARFELFADVLAVGLAVSVAVLPLVTAPAALATACTLLRRRRTYGEPCTAGRFFTALRGRLAHPGEWAAGAAALVFAALLAADAGLAAAGLPGGAPFAAALAAVAAAAAVVGLRSCALRTDEPAPGWGPAVRAGAARAASDLPGSGLVVLALCTAGVCAWALPPVLLLLPGPLALALTAVELRWEEGR